MPLIVGVSIALMHERGAKNSTLDMLIKISEALKVEMWELFDFSHQEN